MSPQITEIHGPCLESIHELKEWLIGRVADDDDIVIDDLQADLAHLLDEEDDENGVKGSEAWVEYVTRANEPDPTDLGPTWEWEGVRKCRFHGKRDLNGTPAGEGGLLYENRDTFQGVFLDGLKNRNGVMTFAQRPDGIERMEGEWKNGLLNGEIKANIINTGWIEGYYKDGVPHGFSREFGPKSAGKSILRMVGRHYKGLRRGIWWKGMYDNSGWVVGEVDGKGEFTGPDIAYIYPDMKMVLRGEFKNEILVRGQLCEIIGVDEKNGIKFPVFSEGSGTVYEYENPTIKNIALHPLLRDPWEDTKVYVKESNLPQGGEGLFAGKDIAQREIVALYNGIKIKTCTYASEHMPRSDYRIRLNGDIDMDIPFGYHTIDQYCATLAHKANHTFLPNVEWTLYEHPRFGLIRSLTAQKPIKKDEEILVNYQMCLAKSPEWYRVVWIHHMRKIKRGDDTAIQRYIDRQYELQGYRIPLPDSEELNVPDPVGVDLSTMPEEYLSEHLLTEEASVKYAKIKAGISEQDENEPRISEIDEEIELLDPQ